MKLYIGSGLLHGDVESFKWQDQALVDWLRSDKTSKALRHGRGKGVRDDEEGRGAREGKAHGRRQKVAHAGEPHGNR